VFEHREELVSGFTKKYGVKNLVFYESTESSYTAIQREKYLKNWNRKWKIELIERDNPEWKDLYDEL